MPNIIPCCPVCKSNTPSLFLQRLRVPVHQNLLAPTPEAAVDITRGDLSMAVCQDCGFVFNTTFDLSLLRYGAEYDNNQTCSSTFRTHLDELVRHLTEDEGVRDCCIVDVGCGSGDFLRRMVEAPGANNTGVGFDPAYRGPDNDHSGRIRFESRYYGPDCTDVKADVVICRHVIEHVPEPAKLLQAIRAALTGSPKARVYFETPDVSWIFRNTVVWDFFYEHCSLFTPQSLSTAFEKSGFAVSSVKTVFGGQYQWLEATAAGQSDAKTGDGSNVTALAEAFAEAEHGLVDRWKAILIELADRGKTALWGAGAKGATFANLLDPNRNLIDCVVDLNPSKQGRFIPGTGHAIVDYRELKTRGVKSAILMNPNYLKGNQSLLSEANISVELICH